MASTQIEWLGQMGQWIGSEPSSEYQLVELAEEGLPTGVVKMLLDHGMSTMEVHSIVIPLRTLKHRKSRQERLSTEESDKAIRLARMLSRAECVLGGGPQALEWMRESKLRFHGRTPFQMLTTESGGRLVEEMLIQIDEGMFA